MAKYIANNYLMNIIEGEYVVLDLNTRGLHLFNQISAFILEHCSGKTADEIAHSLYEQCEDKESLDIQLISDDCQETLDYMVEKSLITIYLDDQS